jgi:hypothetical protein
MPNRTLTETRGEVDAFSAQAAWFDDDRDGEIAAAAFVAVCNDEGASEAEVKAALTALRSRLGHRLGEGADRPRPGARPRAGGRLARKARSAPRGDQDALDRIDAATTRSDRPRPTASRTCARAGGGTTPHSGTREP